jgi:hypothetical protein
MRLSGLERIAGLEGVAAELKQHVEEAHALAAQAASDPRFELRRLGMLRRSPRTSGKMEGPAERRVPPTVSWGIRCINELFGFAQGVLAQ